MRKSAIAALLAGLAAVLGCREAPRRIAVQTLLSPVAGAALVPQVARLARGRILLSWQTPLNGGGYAFQMAIQQADGWSEVRTIASGPGLSMFGADLPGVAELPGGALLAYWELKDSREGDPYATTIQTALSNDDGRTWSTAAAPYGDNWAGQHSFLSWFPNGDGGVGLVWLDASEHSKVRHTSMSHAGQGGGATGATGSIGLRYAGIDRQGRVTGGSFIDPITCECCPTSAAVTPRGPVVVYRGRQDPPGTKPSEVQGNRPTVRDIYITRLDRGRWTAAHKVHADNWVINACPDNGPAVDAVANAVAVAWWTRANGIPKVQVAFSYDAGETFGPAIRVDSGKGEGQVTLALLPGGKDAVIGWAEDGQTWARWVTSTGLAGPAAVLGRARAHSRLPKWIAENGGVTAAWTSKEGLDPHVALSRLGF
ncbi:MAG TPA: hypothetical protein VMH81_32430 [Bryobacteraceae bacterium]|nr:hypothetical protein [Bryobacteraceae bacterium]